MATTKSPTAPRKSLSQIPAHLPDMALMMARAQAGVMETALRQQIETLDFLKARLERDRRFVEALAGARDPAEAGAVWIDYWRHAAEDYATEASRQGVILRDAAVTELHDAGETAAHLADKTRATAV
jgi:hypothetical protein